MFKLKAFIPAAAMLSLGLAWPSAHAATSWSGDLVDFTLVNGDLGALGSPTVTSDDTGVDLSFRPAPLSFDALSPGAGQANNGSAGTDHEAVGFTFKATAAPNQTITGVSWREGGVHQVTGDGSWVSAFASLRIEDATTSQVIGDTKTQTFSASGTGTATHGGPWDLTVNQDVATNSIEIELTVKDILAASALGNGFAWIEKDFGDLRVDVAPGFQPAPIPLPASVWLLGSALSGLITIGRRRVAGARA